MALEVCTPSALPTLPSRERKQQWWSVHLFLDSPRERIADAAIRPRTDALVRDLIGPAIETLSRRGAIRRFFFIRYSELGAHVRLRLEIPTAGGRADEVAEWLGERLATGPESQDEHGTWAPCDHHGLDHWRILPYEPEIERYGGPVGVDLAEDFFDASSRLALGQLASSVDQDMRSARAMLGMVVLLQGLADDRHHAACLASEYSRLSLKLSRSTHPGVPAVADAEALETTFESSWARQAPALSPQVEGLWTALDEGEEIPEPWASFRDGVAAGRQRLDGLVTSHDLTFGGRVIAGRADALRRLAPSYLHMGNNRLGIYVFEEAYLGYLTARLLAPEETPFTTNPQLWETNHEEEHVQPR